MPANRDYTYIVGPELYKDIQKLIKEIYQEQLTKAKKEDEQTKLRTRRS
jgi:tRNA A22 N-methylase